MLKVILTSLMLMITFTSFGQTVLKTKEIKIDYTNGREIIHICTENPHIDYDDHQEYFWYSEQGQIKSTKGGAGGSLLDGNDKFFDDQGNLRAENNYYLGLKNGQSKSWDTVGNVIEISRFVMGKLVYYKHQNADKYWIEFIGPLFKVGTIKRVYDTFNRLESEEVVIPNFKSHIKTYFVESKRIHEDYYAGLFGSENCGKYLSYYEDGKLETDGQFYDDHLFTNLKVGKWKWFKKDGSLDYTNDYKVEIEKWDNGKVKVIGGLIFNPSKQIWIKHGIWQWNDETGNLTTKKVFKFGDEVPQDKETKN